MAIYGRPLSRRLHHSILRRDKRHFPRRRYTEVEDSDGFRLPSVWSLLEMAAKTGVGLLKRRNTVSKPGVGTLVLERRVPTPRPDLFVIKVGDRHAGAQASQREQTSGVLAGVAKVMTSPGANRTALFRSSSGKPVYAYFTQTADPAKLVREDSSGPQTVGRFVGGRFRAIRSAKTI